MIAKKEKGGLIRIYDDEANEIESFTLLHIDGAEKKRLLEAGSWSLDSNNTLIAKTSYKDPLDQVWKNIAVEHQKTSPMFQDVSKIYRSKISGSSMLYRDPVKHVIKIAYRNKNNTTSINKVCIDDKRRDQFFRDCKKAKYFKNNNKYGIDLADKDLYNYWSRYMNDLYIRGL